MLKAFAITIGAIAILVAGFFATNWYIYSEKQDGAMPEPYRAELSGEYVCLPSSDAALADECTLGLHTDVGEYYLIDFNLMSQEMPQIVPGERFKANGLVTPIEFLSTDHWKSYPIEGVFSITDSFEKLFHEAR